MEELKLQWLRRLETTSMGEDEEVKKGYLLPSGAGAPWSDCVGEAMHTLSKLCLLLRDARPVSSLLGQLFLHFMEGNGRPEKEKQNVFSLYITNTHCWVMHDRT